MEFARVFVKYLGIGLVKVFASRWFFTAWLGTVMFALVGNWTGAMAGVGLGVAFWVNEQ